MKKVPQPETLPLPEEPVTLKATDTEQKPVANIPVTSTAAPQPRGRLASILSAGAVMETQKVVQKEAASQESISKYWQKYLEQQSQNEGASFYFNYLKSLAPEWSEDGNIVLSTDNNITITAIDKCKLDIIQFFMRYLDVEKIHLKPILIESEIKTESRKALPLEELLEDVKQNNPSVALLIEKLGLGL